MSVLDWVVVCSAILVAGVIAAIVLYSIGEGGDDHHAPPASEAPGTADEQVHGASDEWAAMLRAEVAHRDAGDTGQIDMRELMYRLDFDQMEADLVAGLTAMYERALTALRVPAAEVPTIELPSREPVSVTS